MKLKNIVISFQCFIIVLIFYTDIISWLDIFLLAVNMVTVNLLATFPKVFLKIITNQMIARNHAVTTSTTCITT